VVVVVVSVVVVVVELGLLLNSSIRSPCTEKNKQLSPDYLNSVYLVDKGSVKF
jgi:hypothetical protein